MSWLSKLKRKSMGESVVIGSYDSDLIETRSTGKTHYDVQTLTGLRQLLNTIESDNGHGTIAVKWWVSGMNFDLSASIPIDVLMKLKNEYKLEKV